MVTPTPHTTNLKTLPRRLFVVQRCDYTPVMKFIAEVLNPSSGVCRLKTSIAVLLVLVSCIASPAFAHHEMATRIGARLSSGLKGLESSMEQKAKAAAAAQKSGGKQEAKPARDGKRKASDDVDKRLILGGAEAFPM